MLMGRLNQGAERPHTQSDPQSRGPIVCLGPKQAGIMEQFLLYVFFAFLISLWNLKTCVDSS